METVVWMDAIPATDNSVSENNSYTRRPGGRGGCAAVAASRMGLNVSLCGVVGKDSDGSKLISYYNENGIDTSCVLTDRRGTGISVHLHESAFGTDRKILCNSANLMLDANQIGSAMGNEPDGVFLTTELPIEQLVESCHLARLHGLPVYLDAGNCKSSPYYGNLENIDLLITDVAGVRSLVGMTITTADRCLPAAIALASKISAKYYIIRLGCLGNFLYDGKYQQHIIPCSLEGKEVGAPVDTEAAVIASTYLLTGDIRNACALGAVMSKMSREDRKNKIPTMAQAVDYCRMNNIRFNK